MENKYLLITLTVAQWQSVLNVLSHAPYAAVTSISDTVNAIQEQAAVQIQELEKAQQTENPQDKNT